VTAEARPTTGRVRLLAAPPGARREEPLNTYDPADGIVYVHLARETDRRPPHPEGDRGCTRLPAGYANQLPSTALGRLRSLPREPALVLVPRLDTARP
jgi:hypothetical protein